MRICSHENCIKKHDSHGFCANHARQFRKYGHVLSEAEKSTHLSEARKADHITFKAENRQKKKWKISPEKRLAAKGICKNTGRTHFKKDAPSWNKGTSGVMTSWNKGIKTGLIPWNKGKTGVMPRPHNKIGDGITASGKIERTRFSKQVRMLVLERDDFTCQICSQRGGSLQVDHIKGWSAFPELRFEQDNCRTVCMACHYYITFKKEIPKGLVWGHNLTRRITS